MFRFGTMLVVCDPGVLLKALGIVGSPPSVAFCPRRGVSKPAAAGCKRKLEEEGGCGQAALRDAHFSFLPRRDDSQGRPRESTLVSTVFASRSARITREIF